MNLHLVDHSATIKLPTESRIVVLPAKDDPTRCKAADGELVIVHTEKESQWIDYAKSQSKIQFLFASRHGLGGVPKKGALSDNAHPCHIPSGELIDSPQFIEFLDSWMRCTPDWSLLLISSSPPFLIAARLILAAPIEIELEKHLPPYFWEFLDEAKQKWAKSAKQFEFCEAAILRGRLKHSWLENQVLNKAPEDVVNLRRNADWPTLQRFPGYAELALSLGEKVELGFSPASLVDSCTVLAALPDAQRKTFRDAVHAAYLKEFDVERHTRNLRDAAKSMNLSLTVFLEEWNKPNEAISDEALLSGWQDVLAAAEPLRAALDALPKGIRWP